jgi:dynein heavy chain, axonemal
MNGMELFNSSPSLPPLPAPSPPSPVPGQHFDVGKGVAGLTGLSVMQGQEPIAMNCLQQAHKSGGWVLLQNVHLTIDWTSGPLEKRVDKLAEGAHPDFRYNPS